jgi:hypothetical protein
MSPIRNDDPRVLMFKQLLARVDALPGVNDPEAQGREVEAIAAQAGEMLKVAGVGAAVAPIFNAFCPEFDVQNDEKVANFQRAAAEVVYLIMEPVMPGKSGTILTQQLAVLSMGDAAPVLRRTFVRNQRMPNLGQYESAKRLFVYRCGYEAGLAGKDDYFGFVEYLADRVPGRRDSFNVKHIEEDWVHTTFVDKAVLDACRSAGKADRAGTALTAAQEGAKAEALLYQMDQIVHAMNLLSKAIRSKP